MAAVRARSSQNFLRASALTATKPSPPRALAMRTTSRGGPRHGVRRRRRRCRRTAPSSGSTAALATWWRSRPRAGSARRGARGPPATRDRAAFGRRVEVVLDLDDRRHRVARLAEELEADGARVLRHRCRIQRADVIRPSQPSFWMPGRPARNLSVTSLPRPSLRKRAACDRPASRSRTARSVRRRAS